MGIPLEINDVLALKPYGYPDDDLCESQMLPKLLEEQTNYSYTKLGYRYLPLGKVIPLVATLGNQQFINVPALVVINNMEITYDPLDVSRVIVTGTFYCAKLLDKSESDKWLTILTNPLNL